MKRRTARIGALFAIPGATLHAQPSAPHVVFFNFATDIARRERAFREGSSELGYGEGRNIIIEHQAARLARADADRLAATIVASRPAVTVTHSYALARSVRADQDHTDCRVDQRRTARALGITIPQSILVRADRVIE